MAPVLLGEPPATPDTRRGLHFSLTPGHLLEPKKKRFHEAARTANTASTIPAKQHNRNDDKPEGVQQNPQQELEAGQGEVSTCSYEHLKPLPLAQSSTLCHLTASLLNEGLKGEFKGCLSDV